MYFNVIVAASTIAVFTALTQVSPEQRQGTGPAPDVIYYNSRIVTVDDEFSYAQAVAIAGDRFSAVGTNEAVRRLAGPNTRLVDLRGMTVVPGLTEIGRASCRERV